MFHRPSPMPWSPTLQDGLEALRDAAETPRDQLLVAQARMYRLLDEIAQSPWRNPDVARYVGPEASPVYYIGSLSGRLEDIVLGVTDPEIAQSREYPDLALPVLLPSPTNPTLPRPS